MLLFLFSICWNKLWFFSCRRAKYLNQASGGYCKSYWHIWGVQSLHILKKLTLGAGFVIGCLTRVSLYTWGLGPHEKGYVKQCDLWWRHWAMMYFFFNLWSRWRLSSARAFYVYISNLNKNSEFGQSFWFTIIYMCCYTSCWEKWALFYTVSLRGKTENSCLISPRLFFL